ncbi:MAG: methyltransferase domain-containing protein [Gemmatimonas sp.]|nr:methyltransferase domain-containing protein [Gemmatimonas sp.]
MRRADPLPDRHGHAARLPDSSDRGLTSLRLRHFEALRPVCPVCRAGAASGSLLAIAHVYREVSGHIVEGILHCANPLCQREYPVIDGIPLLIGNLRHFISENPLRVLLRRDLEPPLESLIGDCLGSGSDFDHVRQQVSAYAWEHYGDLDPARTAEDLHPGTMLGALEAGLRAVEQVPPGPILDVGCGCGRSTFDLAERTGELVLGVDLHYPMLQVATGVLQQSVARYPLRRVGLVYDQREFEVQIRGRENVDFWACDATALPFDPGTFPLAVGLNVLDSVYSPREFLSELASVLRPGGRTVLTCPYDWTAGATPVEAWLGGHSQRSPLAGSSEAVLRAMLTPGASPSGVEGLRIIAELDDLPWRVRLHDRATMNYRLHLIVAERV